MVFHFVTFQFIQPFPGLHRAQGDIKELTNAVKPELPQNHTPAPSKTLFNARLHNPNGHKGAQGLGALDASKNKTPSLW